LPQNREEEIVEERIDLIQEQHDRARAGAAPTLQHVVQARTRGHRCIRLGRLQLIG